MKGFCHSEKSLCSYTAAQFGAGTKLTVLESNRKSKPPTVKILPPSERECRNDKDKKDKKTLVCVAFGFYPDHVSVSWQINGATIRAGVATDDAAHWDGKFYNITSRLRIPMLQWFNPENNFTCTVSFFSGETELYSKWVTGVEDEETRARYLRILQAAKLSYLLLVVKSSVYGSTVLLLLWRFQSSPGKLPN